MKFNREEILEKIEKGIKLTYEEELYYLINILSIPRKEALRIIAITNNYDSSIIID
jgi:hypothetical protein